MLSEDVSFEKSWKFSVLASWRKLSFSISETAGGVAVAFPWSLELFKALLNGLFGEVRGRVFGSEPVLRITGRVIFALGGNGIATGVADGFAAAVVVFEDDNLAGAVGVDVNVDVDVDVDVGVDVVVVAVVNVDK